jgi:hypothetical protein
LIIFLVCADNKGMDNEKILAMEYQTLQLILNERSRRLWAGTEALALGRGGIAVVTRVAFAKLYDRKNALVAAEILNDRVVPFFEQHDIPLLRMLIDRGTEYCGKREHHEYQLYLTLEDIDHSRTKARHLQTNGICERFHKTMQNEFYAVAFRINYTTVLTNCRQI